MNYLLRLYWLILTMNSLSIRADFDATNSTMEAILKGTNTLGFDIEKSGPWSSLLEDWAVGLSDHRLVRRYCLIYSLFYDKFYLKIESM